MPPLPVRCISSGDRGGRFIANLKLRSDDAELSPLNVKAL